MSQSNGEVWQKKNGRYNIYKKEAIASQGMVTSNHPLASAAGVETLVKGGNAIDAAVATLCALTVVEPMMVSIFGAGFMNIRYGDTGEAITIDNYALAPLKSTPNMFEPVEGGYEFQTVGRKNEVGYLAVGVPGAMKAWDYAVKRYGRLSLEEVMEPAARYAEKGYRASEYLVSNINNVKNDLVMFPASAEVFLPGGNSPDPGGLIVRKAYAETLRAIGKHGSDLLYNGPIGKMVAEDMAKHEGLITEEDLRQYEIKLRNPVRGTYRGYEIIAMGPTSSGGTHIIQMLNILEEFDLKKIGFGTADSIHLLAETLKIAFADRFKYMGDPDKIEVPVEGLISKKYAAERRREIDLARAKSFTDGNPNVYMHESNDTTHMTCMDRDGNIVASTQTLHAGFGSKVTTPGTGMLLNNTMWLFDPHPGRANSIAPGKRMLSSMSPTIVLKDGKPFMAIGTPGGTRIFAAVMQGILNVIDHGMTIQEAVEAPRVWTMGGDLNLEPEFSRDIMDKLTSKGHKITIIPRNAGGMNGILIDEEGMLHGGACWRADGSPMGYSGGYAHPKALVQAGRV